VIPGAGGEYQIIIYGVILIILMVYQPKGLSSMGDFFGKGKLFEKKNNKGGISNA
jgi:branched-chain amino acid transport system permease protein